MSSPSVEKGRSLYYAQLEKFLSTVTSLPILQFDRFEVLANANNDAAINTNFSAIINKLHKQVSERSEASERTL